MLTVEIIEYPISMKIGNEAFEREESQSVLFTLKFFIYDELNAGANEQLDTTADYGIAAKFLEDEYSGREVRLVETVIHEVGPMLLKKFSMVKKVEVTLEKTIFPNNVMKTARVKINETFERGKK